MLGLVGLLVSCYLLGRHFTPRDAAGRPLILSPSVQAAETYRRQGRRWVQEMAAVDRGLTELLTEGEMTDPAQLYDASRKAERLTQRAQTIHQACAFTRPPLALQGLSEDLRITIEAHVEAARVTGRWVGAPEEDTYAAALEALRLARGLRAQVAQSRWLHIE